MLQILLNRIDLGMDLPAARHPAAADPERRPGSGRPR
ncbi:hypothetical protein [Actinomadura fibrosa]